MKSSRSWLALGCALTLAATALAQEVIVGAPRLYPQHPPMDTLPQAKNKLRVDFPEEMRTSEQPEYGVIIRSIDAGGQSRYLHSTANAKPYERELRDAYGLRRWSFQPGTVAGKPATAVVYLTVVFNPPAASRRRDTAIPRLLAAEPVFLPVEKGEGKQVLPATFTVDETGAILGTKFRAPLGAPLQAAFDRAVSGFRFEPALKDGKPVGAEVTVPIIVLDSRSLQDTKMELPKVVKQERPDYPVEMRRFGLVGEVLLRFQVDESGAVRNPFVQQSTNPTFDIPAIDAVRKWRFQPAKRNGVPVSVEMMVPIIFELNQVEGREPFRVTLARDQSKLPPELRYDAPPKIRHVSIPVHPYPLLKERKEGEAQVRMLIGQDGKIGAVHVVSADRPEFGAALAAAVEEFEFDPAMNKGRAVPHILNFEHRFRTSSVDSSSSALLRDEVKNPAKIAGASKLDAVPNPISRRAPRFPVAVDEKVTEGEATIEFLIDDEGRAKLPRIVSATEPAFGYAAVQAVSTWAFDPPTAGGKPTDTRVVIPFKFKRGE